MLAEFLKKLLDLPDDQQNELLNHFQNVIGEVEYQRILKHISTIEDDPYVSDQTRLDTLERIRRYTSSAARKTKKREDRRGILQFSPVINKYEMVWVNFAGIGSEHDRKHLAIVWDVDYNRDHVLILPTTSFKDDSVESGISFNIGRIGFLSKETQVMLDQTMSVSRKRIMATKHEEPVSKRPDFVRLSPAQKQRIQEGFRILWFEEKTLFQELLEAHRNRMPQLQNADIQYSHLHRPFIKIWNGPDKLVYALHDRPHVSYTVHRHAVTTAEKKRRGLLYTWAKAITSNGRTREQNIQLAYEAMQAEILQEKGMGGTSEVSS